MNLNTAFSWTKNPTRVIHFVVSWALVIGAVALNVAHVLNGAETWVGAGVALGNLIQGEVNRTQVSPTTTITTTTTPNA